MCLPAFVSPTIEFFFSFKKRIVKRALHKMLGSRVLLSRAHKQLGSAGSSLSLTLGWRKKFVGCVFCTFFSPLSWKGKSWFFMSASPSRVHSRCFFVRFVFGCLHLLGLSFVCIKQMAFMHFLSGRK